MRKTVLFLTSLSNFALLVGCAGLPEFPEINQCAWSYSHRAFFCVNTRTKEKTKRSYDDAVMKGAQCMSLDDYKQSEAWVQSVMDIAKTKCQAAAQ